MTVLSAVVGVVVRKVRAFVAEVRALIAAAEGLERERIWVAKQDILSVKSRLGAEVAVIKNDLLAGINKL